MCGRYTIEPVDQILERFDVSGAELDIEPTYNAAPTQHLPVIVRESSNRLMKMRWGLIPSWTKKLNTKYSTINARAETLSEKPMYRKPFHSQRCLVPASGFYEFMQTVDGKVPFYFHLKDTNLFAFAGIYDVWTDGEGQALYSFTIVTVEPNELVENFHDRMPVILRKEDEEAWLEGSNTNPEQLMSLLKPYPEEEMDAYRVSTRVNSPRNNEASLLQRE